MRVSRLRRVLPAVLVITSLLIGGCSNSTPDSTSEDSPNPALDTSSATDDTMSAAETAPEDGADAEEAAAVIRAYYDAIDDGKYRQAYGYWEDSEQTFEAFTAGFEETAGVSVEVARPGRVEAAAGSRYVDVPVSVHAVSVDGRRQAFRGTYVLRKSVVPGASAEQRTWRIYSADLVGVEPAPQR